MAHCVNTLCRNPEGRLPSELAASKDTAPFGHGSVSASILCCVRGVLKKVGMCGNERAVVAFALVPNFFIAGAPKAGTTSLYHYLDQHPQVYMCPIKEPNFFAEEIREENCGPELRRGVCGPYHQW